MVLIISESGTRVEVHERAIDRFSGMPKLFTFPLFDVFMRISLAPRALTLEDMCMRSWMNANDGVERVNAAFQGFKRIFPRRLKTSASGAGIRAPIAVGGIFMVLASTAVATDMVTPGQFRNTLAAMVPLALTEPEAPVRAEVVGYGEVVAARESSLPAHVDGRVAHIPVGIGDAIREGDTIMRIDDADALRLVREAESDVVRAELALARLKSSDEHANEVPAAPAADISAVLDRAYIKISDMFPSLPDVLSGLAGVLHGGLFLDPTGTSHLTVQADRAAIENPAADGMKLRATERYTEAKRKHEVAIARLRSVPGNPDDATLESVVGEANEAVQALFDATDAMNSLFGFLKKHLAERGLAAPPVFKEYNAALSAYSSQLEDQAGLLTRIVDDVRAAREGPPNAPTDTGFEREEAELELRRAQNALLDARASLARYDVKASFDGIVARIEKKTAQHVFAGDTVATLVSSDMLATVSLGRGEVERVKLGQNTLVSFDGSDLQVRGRVAEIGKAENEEDGMVRFTVTIALATDERVKPGMQFVARFLEE